MFRRRDTPTEMSGLVIHYDLTDIRFSGEITANRNGVGVGGRFPPMSTESCVQFEETLARARIHAQHLRERYDLAPGSPVQPLTEEEVDRILGPIPFEE